MIALAGALREHTNLQDFIWVDTCSRPEAAQITALDPLLRVLPACPHLRKVTIITTCASADAMKNLLQLHSATHLHLVLETNHWLAVADEIRQGKCNIKNLKLAMRRGTISGATETVKAVASAIREDTGSNLECLMLKMEDGFTDEAGVALAEALTVNKTLRKLQLDDDLFYSATARTKASLGAQTYEAFSATLRVNTSLSFEPPPFDRNVSDERDFEHLKLMQIELRLNQVGRGRLMASRQTTREEWVDALHELSTYDVDDPHAFRVSCLYSLLQLNPAMFMLKVDSTSESCE
jgi:hypothetical protein